MPQMWNKILLEDNSKEIGKHSKNLLFSENPYQSVISKDKWPTSESLIQSSSLLSVVPELKKREDALDIAKSEYVHFVAQTYFFELLGFQIVSDLAIHAEQPSQVHAFMSQAADEARHAQAYSEMVRMFPGEYLPAACVPRLYTKVIAESSFPEKVLLGLVVLESLAIGLFSARTKLYSGGPTHALDRQALREESRHHHDATQLMCSMLRENRMSFDSVRDIVKSGIQEISRDLLPFPVAKQFGIGLTNSEVKGLGNNGLIGLQSKITRSALMGALRSLCETQRQKVGVAS